MLADPEIERGLGEDFVLTLKAVLVDPVGRMVRHRVMDGVHLHPGHFQPRIGQDHRVPVLATIHNPATNALPGSKGSLRKALCRQTPELIGPG